MIVKFDRKKSQREVDPRVRQIDALAYLAQSNRDQFLSPPFLKTCEELYNLSTDSGQRPSFRPAVSVPQLQLLNLNEATDLASIRPKVYIVKPDKKQGEDDRDERRERAFQDAWTEAHNNVKILKGSIWSLYAGTGFYQVGLDPWARRGKGEVYLDWRSPREVLPDSTAKEWKDWSYAVVEDRMYLDEVRARFPGPGDLVRPRETGASVPKPSNSTLGAGGYGFTLPSGPMSTGYSMPVARSSQGWDGTVVVRTCFTEDYGVEEVKGDDKDVNKALEALSKFDQGGRTVTKKLRRKFPNRRMLIECEGIMLSDGDNYAPFRMIPVFPQYSLPNLTNVFAPPPTRFSLNLQDLAGQMLSQVAENIIRTNNGVWFIHEDTGINAEEFGAFPAEVRVINSGSPIPQVIWPQEMPQHAMAFPEFLLMLQEKLQGFSKERQGDSGEGNVGAGVFDTALFQSAFMTRMRSMLLSECIEDITRCMFYMMGEYYQADQYFPSFTPNFTRSKWEPITSKDELDEWDFYLDHASVRPISQAAFAKSILGMRQAGLIDTQGALEELDVPDAAAKAAAVQHEEELAALAKLKRK